MQLMSTTGATGEQGLIVVNDTCFILHFPLSWYFSRVKAVLILGGHSRRFAPLRQKPLFSICGKVVAQHLVHRLNAAGLEDIILVGSAENLSEIQSLFPGLKVVEQPEGTMGMHHAVAAALPHCEGESVMVVGGNDFVDARAYRDLISAAEGKDGAILAQKVDQYFPGGYLSLDGDRISGIVEKPGEGNEPSDLVNVVAHVHNDPQALLSEIEKLDDTDDTYERALQSLFGQKKYSASVYDGVWQAVKYPWHLLHLLPELLSELQPDIHKAAEVHPSAVVDGDVILSEGVRVMPGAMVRGPCFIGPRTIIGNGSLVRGSSVGADCVIGYNTEVKGAILGDHVWTHVSYIGDSVIGNNVSFGGGSITANFRLDEGDVLSGTKEDAVNTHLQKCGCFIGDNCRLGIQVGLSPGISIGSGTFVSSGTLVTENVAGGQFVRMKDGVLTSSENRIDVGSGADREKYRGTV